MKKTKKKFASMAHDANNSLLVIKLSLEPIEEYLGALDESYLVRSEADPTKYGESRWSYAAVMESVASIKEGVARTADVIKDIHNFATHEAAIKLTPLPISDRIADMERMIPIAKSSYGITLLPVFNVSDDCHVYADADLAKQVVTKIIENASKAGATQVKAFYQEHAETVTICFGDDGKGMNQAMLETLGFMPTSHDASGGKGVRLIRHLINDTGGTVVWHSVEGIGTQVIITLRKVIYPPSAERGRLSKAVSSPPNASLRQTLGPIQDSTRHGSRL